MSSKTQHIPVVVVSGSSEPNIERTVKELGAHHYLPKPVDPNDLGDLLLRLLEPPVSPKTDS